MSFAIEAEGERHEVALAVPGRHNASNALAAIAATRALGVRLEDAINALARFEGLRRRLETVGEAGGVTVIDDFAHNPDKIDATLATLCARSRAAADPVPAARLRTARQDGRGARRELRGGMAADDRLYLPDPVYQGGTVERTRGSDWLADASQRARQARRAYPRPRRDRRGAARRGQARRPHRVMGARDDTLAEFARDLVERLGVGTEAAASLDGQTRNRYRLEAAERASALLDAFRPI